MPLDKLILSIVLAVMVIVIIVASVWTVGKPSRSGRAWEELARATPGLRVESDGAGKRLFGSLGGVQVEAVLTNRGPSGSSRWYTYVTATCSGALPRDFVLRPHERSADMALREHIGGILPQVPAVTHTIAVGDPSFDGIFMVGGADPNEVRAFLGDPRLRKALVDGQRREPRVAIAGGQVIVERRDAIATTTDLRSMLETAAEVAQAVAWAGHGEHPG